MSVWDTILGRKQKAESNMTTRLAKLVGKHNGKGLRDSDVDEVEQVLDFHGWDRQQFEDHCRLQVEIARHEEIVKTAPAIEAEASKRKAEVIAAREKEEHLVKELREEREAAEADWDRSKNARVNMGRSLDWLRDNARDSKVLQATVADEQAAENARKAGLLTAERDKLVRDLDDIRKVVAQAEKKLPLHMIQGNPEPGLTPTGIVSSKRTAEAVAGKIADLDHKIASLKQKAA